VQNIEAAAEWYRIAADLGHAEGEVNYQRCLRLLGRWAIPDRSSSIADRLKSDDLARDFLTAVEDPVAADQAGTELVASIERLKDAMVECAGPRAEWVGGELVHENSHVVLAKDREEFIAVKTAAVPGVKESIRHEIDILKTLNHPLVVRIREPLSGAVNQNQAVVTEFVENGSLADHLPDAVTGDLCRLHNSTRIVRIIAGIVLAMRCLYWQNVIHHDLSPENVLLDWDWNVRICDFGDSISPDYPQPPVSVDRSITQSWCTINQRYLSPECYRDIIVPEGDVFSFGLILYELIIGRPVFPKGVSPYTVMKLLSADDWCPDIPEYVNCAAADLIRDCLAVDYRVRPSFIDILDRLKRIQFKLMAGVNSEKIAEFVDMIEKRESL
jgi:serine/threonine protein kinase